MSLDARSVSAACGMLPDGGMRGEGFRFGDVTVRRAFDV